MKNIDQLEKLEKKRQRELSLARRHEQNATDLKNQIELLRGNVLLENCSKLNLNADEFTKVLSMMKSKTSLIEAADMVLSQRGEPVSEQNVIKKSEISNMNIEEGEKIHGE